ncbi:basal body-orientation factor 1 [Pelmatolapia mariae]|uniref:basal body-orientation factor 1 n=1 Tax=Pelmatolapia mariae TaxID=158779 RepID=UPI002FE58206
MPTKKASKSKKAKGGKEKKEGKRDSKTDKESDVEKAKANAVLWELRLKATEQSLRDYTESCQKVARANEHLTNQLYHAEKDAIHIAGHWERQLAAKEEKICVLEKALQTQQGLAREEKDKLVSELNMIQEEMKKMKEIEVQREQDIIHMKQSSDDAHKKLIQHLREKEDQFLKEMERLEKETKACSQTMAKMAEDHREAIVRLKDALHSVIKERDCLSDKLKYHIKEAEDLQKLAKLLTEENTSLALDKSMLELTVKDNAAQLGTQKQKLSELRAEVASLEEALQLKAVEIEQQEKKEKANLVTIQASQVELDKLQKVLAMREKELKHVKQLASTIVAKRQELEEFFHEALGHVRKEIKDSRLQYKKEALQSYRRRFREATAGKIKFPPIRTFHKTAHSTNSVYSDMEAAATWTDQPGGEVEISDLTWEQKEQVLRLLFAKMNGCRESQVSRQVALPASTEKRSFTESDVAGIREELSPATMSTPAPSESTLHSRPAAQPDTHIT